MKNIRFLVVFLLSCLVRLVGVDAYEWFYAFYGYVKLIYI